MSIQYENLLKTSRFSIVRKKWQSADGETHQKETIQHPGAVTIIPILDGNRVCLIKNYRIAVEQTLIELPAGTLEPNEPPEQTAFRELAEETGYQAKKMQKIYQFSMSPGILNESMHVFVATELTAGEQQTEPGEEITQLEVPWQQALEMVESGKITDAKTIAALLLYERIKEKV